MFRVKYQCLAGSLSCVALVAWKVSSILNNVNIDDEVVSIGVSIGNIGILDTLQLTVYLTFALLLIDIYRLNPADSQPMSTLWQHYITFKLWQYSTKIVRWRHERHTRNVKYYQDKIFREILDGANKTVYYKDKKLGKINTPAEFRQLHPLTNYANIKAYVDRSLLGEANTLFNDDVTYWAATTGTTSGKSKLYPKNGKRIRKLFFRDVMRFYADMKDYPGNQGLAPGFQVNVLFEKQFSDQGVRMGPISGISEVYYPGNVIPIPGLRITEMKSAFYVQLLFGMKVKDICWIAGPFASHMLTFFRMMEEYWDELCFDIQTGQINRTINLNENTRRSLQRCLKPDRHRALELRQIFHTGFQNIASRIWPNLSMIAFVSTGPFQAYSDIIQEKYVHDIPIHCPMVMATEGVFGVNAVSQAKRTNFVLTPYSAFFEFIPRSELDAASPQTLLAEEVTVGEEYELVITTLQGLYRYRTQDIIRVVGFYNQAPMYEFIQRLGDNLDLFGEKTPAAILENVMHTAFSQWRHLELTDYTCTESVHLQRIMGVQSDKMYYVIFIEVYGDVAIIPADAEQLDLLLIENQEEYEVDRHANKISQLKLIQVKPGTFEKLKYLLISSNPTASFNQLKMPRVTRRDDCIRLLLDEAVCQNYER